MNSLLALRLSTSIVTERNNSEAMICSAQNYIDSVIKPEALVFEELCAHTI